LRDIASAIYFGTAFFFAVRLLTGWCLIRKLICRSRTTGLSGVYESDSVAVPLALGLVKPKILLPNVWRDWDSAKLDVILAHERAHISRHDSLMLHLARLNRCLFWFHPLAWWLERKLALLAEQACDEAFLAVGGDRKRYARLLLEMAVAIGNARGRVYHQALGMASRIGQRIDRVLDEHRLPCRGLSARGWMPLLIASVPLVYAAGAVRIERLPSLASFEFPHFPPPSAPAYRPVPPALLAQTPLLQNNTAGSPQVVVHVSVTDQTGALGAGIAQSAFKVYEDGVEQPLTIFRVEEVPVSMGILIESSARVRDKRALIETVETALMRGASAEDEFFMIHFNDDAYLDQPLTTDKQKIEAAFERFGGRGGTAMLNAISSSIAYAKDMDKLNRKVLLVVADADDNEGNLEQLAGEAQRNGVQIYSIGLLNADEPRESRNAPSALKALAEACGGMDYSLASSAEADQIVPLIKQVIHNEYVLGYTPKTLSSSAASRRINVIVNDGQIPVSFRVDP
jgi:VWFA-related protein